MLVPCNSWLLNLHVILLFTHNNNQTWYTSATVLGKSSNLYVTSHNLQQENETEEKFESSKHNSEEQIGLMVKHVGRRQQGYYCASVVL